MAADASRTSLKIRNKDIDLRQRTELIDENSQEVNDKFNMILKQAQEQVENNDANHDQIQCMVQQMIKMKTDSDARKTFKRANSVKPVETEEASEVFSSDTDDETLNKSHRVPNKRRRNDEKAVPAPNATINNNSAKPPTIDTTITSSPPQKERRVRKTKWNSPWEEPAKPVIPMQIQPNLMPNLSFPALRQPTPNISNAQDNNVRQFSSDSIWQQNPMPFNGLPVVNQIALLNNTGMVSNIIGNSQLIMAQHGSSAVQCGAKERTINIDGIPREIRFYKEIAIAFMKDGGLEPKEIGFQSGERRLCVDNNESIVLAFNDTYKPFMINGNQYQIRFGSPTRELYIDNEWYECFFGDPSVGIVLNNKLHSFRIDGPAPQVRIGNLRSDLVVGKVDMYVDIQTKVTLFLDAEEQRFQINNQVHTIQFADYFLTVLIDEIPFPVQYGAMPMKFQLVNSEHYIRFSVLPNDIVPGQVYVRNMVRTKLQRDLVSPPPIINAIPPVTGPILPLMSIVPNPEIIASSSTNGNNIQSTTINSSSQPNVPVISEKTNSSSVDVNDLYQKLLASGIFNKLKETTTSPTKEKEKPLPISLSKPESLKKRQVPIVDTLFSGMQCSSCGARFPIEQTIKYSQHLDWHYRQNRRERDSARKAHSRKWYYDVSDWIQYEEIENLDEREKNWFETQQNDIDTLNEDSNQRTNSPPPSCVAGPEDNNRKCEMCHDQFETFYNEETEEWHLRNALRVEDNIYHPVCYEDFKVNSKLFILLTQLDLNYFFFFTNRHRLQWMNLI